MATQTHPAQSRTRWSVTAPNRPPSPHAQPYRRHRPETTTLHRIVREHLETYLTLANESDPMGDGVPTHVERAFRSYLKCGILALGFARARCPSCGYDFLVAFSCKGRGACPSSNAKRMAGTAAHLVDHVFPHVPVRQFVLSVPKRLRPFLHHRPRTASAVLHILLRALQATLREACPTAPPTASFAAASFLHRFGSSLNAHYHFHLCVVDGLFEATEMDQHPGTETGETGGIGTLRFHEATGLTHALLDRLQHTVRSRVLRHFRRHGILETHEAEDMLTWDHGGGFSLDASVRIEATDRTGLERLIRYCARPPFALDRLHLVGGHSNQILYVLPKPDPAGRTALRLSALEFLDRLAKILPPPRIHRHRYHGVFAPNAPLRPLVTQRAHQDNALAAQMPVQDLPLPLTSAASPPKPEAPAPQPPDTSPSQTSKWGALLARIYEVFPLICPSCQTPLSFIAFASPYYPPTATPSANSASLRFSPTQSLSPESSPTSVSPPRPRSSIHPEGHPRPSSPWVLRRHNDTRSSRSGSPTTSIRLPPSTPPSPSPFPRTTLIRAGARKP